MSIIAKLKQGLGLSDQADTLKDDVKDWYNDKWNDQKNAFIMFHQSIWRVLLFYAGEMWITPTNAGAATSTASVMFAPTAPTDEYTPQPKINRFAPAIDAVAANFARVPEVEAVPKSNVQMDDVRIAGICKVANAIIDHSFIDNGFDGVNHDGDDIAGEAAQLFTLTGTVFSDVRPWEKTVATQPKFAMENKFAYQCVPCDKYETGLDEAVQQCPNCQQPVDVRGVDQQVPVMDEEDPTQQAQQEIKQWQVRGQIKNPLYALPRIGAKSMSDAGYMFWAERYTLDQCAEIFDIQDAEPDNVFLDGYSVTMQHALQYYYAGYAGSTAQAKDSCMVLQIMIEPGKVRKFPDGLYAIIVNEDVKMAQPWPWPTHPLTKGNYLQMPTMFFARSPGFDLANVQSELKDYESLIKLHAMVAAVDSIVVDENTRVSEITGRADKVIYWKSIGPGSKEPHRMRHGVLDDGVYKQRDSLHSELQNISGAVSVYRGEQPGSVTAASAISQLRGQAEMMYNKPNTNWKGFWRETGRKFVLNVREYYTVQQLVGIVGQNHLDAIMDFMNSDIDSLLDFVASDHGLPRTRDDRRQEMMEMFDRGALDINDANVKEKLFELFGETGMFTQFSLDATRARAENKGMITKLIKPVLMPLVEDMAVHLSVHAECIKSLEYDTYPPDVKTLLFDHYMETYEANIQKQLQTASAMSAAGAPPPKPPTDAKGKGNTGAVKPGAAQPKPAPPKPGTGGAPPPAPEGTQL